MHVYEIHVSVLNRTLFNLNVLLLQTELLELFHNGKRKKFFDVWIENLTKGVRENDSVAQKLEFYLNIYFAVYPMKFAKGQVIN